MTALRCLAASAGLVCLLVVGALYADHSSRASLSADADAKVITHHIQAKDAIAQDLIADRLPFAEAVARFRSQDDNRPAHLPLRLPEAGSGSVEDCYSVYVLGWAQQLLADNPSGEAISTRLAGERQEYVAGTAADLLANAGL